MLYMGRPTGLEPAKILEPQSSVLTNFTTAAITTTARVILSHFSMFVNRR